MADKACTVRTRKFMTNRLLARKQFVSKQINLLLRTLSTTRVRVLSFSTRASAGIWSCHFGEKHYDGCCLGFLVCVSGRDAGRRHLDHMKCIVSIVSGCSSGGVVCF